MHQIAESVDFSTFHSTCLYKTFPKELSDRIFGLLRGSSQKSLNPMDKKKLTEQYSLKGLYGQVPKRVDRQAFQHEMWAVVQDWKTPRLKAVLGIINNLTYQAAKCAGAIIRGFESKQVRIVRERLLRLVKSGFALETALNHTVEFLNRHWAKIGASNSKNSVRGHINHLRDMGLLEYESKKCEKGEKYNTRVYTYLDIPKLLCLAEMIETALLEPFNQWDEPRHFDPTTFQDVLPAHGGLTTKLMFDALFPGWGYRRIGDGDTVEDEVTPINHPFIVSVGQAAREELEKLYLQEDIYRSYGIHGETLLADLYVQIEELEKIADPPAKVEPLPAEMDMELPW